MSYSYGSDHSKHVGCHNALVFMQSRSTEKVQYRYLDLSESHLFTSEEAFPTLASMTMWSTSRKSSGDSGSMDQALFTWSLVGGGSPKPSGSTLAWIFLSNTQLRQHCSLDHCYITSLTSAQRSVSNFPTERHGAYRPHTGRSQEF